MFGGVRSDISHFKDPRKKHAEISHFFRLKFLATVRLTDGRSVVQCSPASFLSDSESEVGGESNGGLEAQLAERHFMVKLEVVFVTRVTGPSCSI